MSAAESVKAPQSAAPKHPFKSKNSNSQDGQQPKRAWTGGANPITQRPSTNGTAKPTPPRSSQQMQPSGSSGDMHADKHANDRTAFLCSQFIGKDATITLTNGEEFCGVFSGLNKTRYVLKMSKRTKSAGNTEPVQEYIGEGEDHVMGFEVQDTADLFVTDVSTATVTSHQNGSIGGSFLTDTQISAREASMQRQRELQRWDAGPDNSIDLSLESSSNAEWDQFAANERMYGVQSSYDENIYTTAIDRSNPEYRRREAEAEKIAREIEGSEPANAHVAEERTRDSNKDDAGDEEDKYSGVRREAAATLPRRAANAYVPPSQRPITGAPTVHGAPFDPAIISTQLSKPSPSPAAAQGSTPPPPASSAQPVPVEHPTQALPPVTSKETTAPSATLVPAPKKKENTTEDRVRDTADAFKQFANTEKLRIRQAQEQKRANVRQEKNVKLNDLKKFAANFKLKSRVPDDLVPILAKDREKQLEIQSKAEEAAKEEEEVKAKEKLSDKASNTTSPAPSAVSTQPAPTSAVEPRPPYNHRIRGSQQLRGVPIPPGQAHSPRVPLGQRIQTNQQMYANRLGGPQPTDLRIPSGPPVPPAEMPMSPNSATRLNVNAKSFEFRPGASAFTPTGTSPSPQRSTGSGVGSSAADITVPFFDKDKPRETKSSSSAFDPLKRMAEADYDEKDKKKFTPNGGLPQAYNTHPTWPHPEANVNLSYLNLWPQPPAASQGPSPMHTPNPNAQMPHAHQLPAHMQQPPAVSTLSPQYYRQHHGPGPSFDPRMQQQFGPNGSVQNSPRVPQPMPVTPFNGQMPPMPVQQFPGQPMPGYGMSPSVQYRQPAMQGGPTMMMNPGQQQGQMGPMQPGYPPGPPFRGPQMGGHMMVQQHSSGGYGNGPMPQSGFSPMPPHAQPHMGHMQQYGGPGGYGGSPRPPMMQHQGSQQGFQPGMQMQPHFAPSPGQAHPYHLQNRAMSGGFPHMTPRQQHAVPNHPSPGMAVGLGDEGK